ncbi:MAG: hypothetical protein HUJ73_01090, partial [Eubacterium sp.]|nr:hypothetical protein [Eubacterium sp.]
PFKTYGGDNGVSGFLVMTKDENGNQIGVFREAELYEKREIKKGNTENTEEVYYVDPQVFRKGEVIVKPNSTQTFTIGESASLEGVYCTNRGYAVFRKIEIMDQNKDYCIVENGTEYGIAQYDYIVRDGRDVREEQIVSGTG